MAGTPYLISEGSETSGNLTAILVPNIATSAGDVIHVSANCSSASVTTTSVTDTQGNTYALINSDTAEVNTYEFETTNSPTVALNTVTDAILVHFSGTGGAKSAIAVGLPGYTSGHDVAPTPVDGASATASSIASGTLGQANEVLIAVLSTGAQATAPTWGAGWTQVGQTRQASNPWLTVACKVVSATTSVNATASWPSSVKYCTLLTSYKAPSTPAPTGLYHIGEASAAAGGASTTLSVPISTPTAAGDTITVGAVATAGSVTGVTDSAGNSYSLVQSETANAACQVYTFESYDTDPVVTGSGSNPHAGLVGATSNFKSYRFLYTAANATSGCVFTMGNTVQHSLPNGTKIQFFDGTPPGGFTTGTNYFVIRSSGTSQSSTGTSFMLAATLGGSPIGGTSNGSGAQTFQISDGTYAYTALGSASEFDVNMDTGGFTGLFSHGATGAQKRYFNPGQLPASLTDDTGQDITPLVNTGVNLWLCIQPNPNGSDATAVQNMLSYWKTHATGKIKVVFYQEYGNLAQADYINTYKNYYSIANGLGIPVVYDAAGSQRAKWTAWYPGNAFVDVVAVDYYGSTWRGQTSQGTTNLDPLLPLRQLADNNGKPFGIGEIGQAVWNAGATCSDTLFIQYIEYITSMMTQRLQQGLTNSDVMWFNGFGVGVTYGANGNALLPNDWRIPYLQTLYNQLTSPSAGGITVTYSGTASAQGAIAIGNSNVQSGDDKAVGATATTGTTASVATGALGQAEEDIIAFVADLSAGGAATLGDSLTAASSGFQAGAGGPFFKAGYKTVNSASSDTPSATIVSATWSISAVTHKINTPVILGTEPGTAFVGQAFSYTAMASGGTGALTWSDTGTLTPGLTFTSGGLLSGTPTTAGTYTYNLIVTDSLGLSSSITVTQQVVAAGSGSGGGSSPGVLGTAPATPLPGNILSLADSDSETMTGYTWAAAVNASTPAEVTTTSVTGGASTGWTALAAGATQIATGLYPCNGSKPYIASCFLFTNQLLLANVGIAWYDITQTLIATQAQPNNIGTVPNGWTPLTFASVAPANAAFSSLVLTVNGAAAGQSFNMDLAYLAQSAVQVLIDWNNATYAAGGNAGQLFMDVSPFVRFDQALSYTRGRQDAISQVQPGSASFSLQNDLGTFTRLSSTSIPASIGGTISLQRRCQLNLADEGGVWWTRFDGSIAQIDYTFDTTGNTSLANITLTDVLSNLNRQDPLFCWTKEQVLADGPMWHWTLDDPGDTGGTGPAGQGVFGTGAETSGSNGPPMRLFNTDSTKVATIAWQSTTGGVETLANAVAVNQSDGSEFWAPGVNVPSNALRGLDSGTVGSFTTPLGSVYFTPVLTAQSAQNQFVGNTGYYLQAELPQTLAMNNSSLTYAFECWFTMDPQIGAHLSSNYGPYIPLSFGSSRQKATFVAGLFLNAGALKFEAALYNQPPSFLGLNWPGQPPPSVISSVSQAIAPDTVQRPHHLVVNIFGSGTQPVAVVYLDGARVGSVNLNKGQVIDTVVAGSAYGGSGSHYGGIQLVSVYTSGALSQQQITTHAMLGQYGMWEQPSDDVLAQIESYANVPGFWSNVSAQHKGLTMMEYIDITGSNALTAMQLVAQAEAGLLFVNAAGALNFHTRDWRMGYGAPDLLLPPESFSPNMSFGVTDQFLTNEMGVAGPATTGATAQQGTTTSATTGALQQPPNAVSSANVQAGYVNTTSQGLYGIYAANPVSAPISLPLITWSRAYAQLGIPSLSYWPDPALFDVAAWNSNSRSDPFLFPASLTVDLLTLDPNDTVTTFDSQGDPIVVPIGISTFYALEIDNMVAPTGTLPQAMPNVAGSLEWFIEGVSETVSLTSRQMTLYVSPAGAQRAWIPGDPVYGVVGSTTRLGISQSDLSTPQADGKDVSHDAGPPYWPPTFSQAMNNPDGAGNGFVGSGDMRGILNNLKLALQPPMCIVSAVAQGQSFGTGALSNPAMNWDVVHVDTEGGMGLYPGWPNWYVCTVPGFYEISASLIWAVTSAQAGYTGLGWIAVAQQAAQALGANTGTPLTVGKYICPVGEAVRFNGATTTPVCNAVERIYLGLGDMVALCGEHNFTSARGTSTSTVGSHMSIRFVGLATQDDRTQINSSLSAGGTVTAPTSSNPGSFTYANTHTFAYQGPTGFSPFSIRNTDHDCFQGTRGGTTTEGSQTTQVEFNTALIASQLNTHTITSASLQCTNLTSFYPTGTKLMLGYTTQAPGASSYQPASATDFLNTFHQFFQVGENLTFSIPIGLVQAMVTGGATAFVLGDTTTKNLNYYGTWKGGPGSWTLTVKYK